MSGKKSHKTTAEYLQYLKGELSGRERNAFERKMETHPFEKDALEGLEGLSPGEAEEDILALHARLNKRLTRRRRIAWYSAAATVASLLIVGTIFLQIHDFNTAPEDKALREMELPVTMDEQPETEAEAVEADHKAKETGSQSDEDLRSAKEPSPRKESAPASHVATQPEIVVEEATPADRGDETTSEKGGAASIENVTEVPEKKGMQASKSRVYELSEAKKAEEPALSAEELSEVIMGKVQGVVTSAEDQGPLPGASVMIRGTATGVVTDMQGQFSLPVEEDQSTTLVASYIGMETLEQQAFAGSEVELVMQPSLATLDEVVVVAYGSEPATTGEVLNREAEPATGYKAFRQYIEESIRFPAAETDTTISRAVVVLKFTLTAEGEITEVRPLRSPGIVFTDEATRLVMEGPSWNPAINPYGTSIEEEVRLRIVFKR